MVAGSSGYYGPQSASSCVGMMSGASYQQAMAQQQQARSYPSQEQIARVELLVKGKKVESKGIFASMKDGVAEFFHDNRTMISWLALIFVVDHFFFKGAFRDRLHKMVENMIGKIEEKIAK